MGGITPCTSVVTLPTKFEANVVGILTILAEKSKCVFMYLACFPVQDLCLVWGEAGQYSDSKQFRNLFYALISYFTVIKLI